MENYEKDLVFIDNSYIYRFRYVVDVWPEPLAPGVNTRLPAVLSRSRKLSQRCVHVLKTIRCRSRAKCLMVFDRLEDSRFETVDSTFTAAPNFCLHSGRRTSDGIKNYCNARLFECTRAFLRFIGVLEFAFDRYGIRGYRPCECEARVHDHPIAFGRT